MAAGGSKVPSESSSGTTQSTQMKLLQLEAGMEVPLDSLEISNPTTEYSVDLARVGNLLGSGGEKTALEYTDRRGTPIVITVEAPPKNARIASARFPASVAMNARLANYISRPGEIVAGLEQAHAAQKRFGIKGYHYLQVHDRYPGKEAIGEMELAAFNLFVKALSGNRSLHPDTFGYQRPEQFPGGLVGYINYLARHVKTLNPHLPIGAQVFPEIYLFGVFGQREALSPVIAARAVAQAQTKGRQFNPKLAGRPFMTMEKYDTTLDQIIDASLEFIMQGRNQTERFTRMRQVVSTRFPTKAFTEIIVNMNLVHSLGFCFGDLKLPNLAFKTVNSEVIGLIADPGLVREGKRVLYASEYYLPEGNIKIGNEVRHPRSELNIGRLRASRVLDNHAMTVIRKAVFEGFEDPYAFDRFLKEYRRSKEESPGGEI